VERLSHIHAESEVAIEYRTKTSRMVRAYKKIIPSFSATHNFIIREVITEEKVSRSEADDSYNMFCSWATFLSCWRSNAADDGSAKIECQLALVSSWRRRERICRQTEGIAGMCLYRTVPRSVSDHQVNRTCIIISYLEYCPIQRNIRKESDPEAGRSSFDPLP